jgi:hypothetical protein
MAQKIKVNGKNVKELDIVGKGIQQKIVIRIGINGWVEVISQYLDMKNDTVVFCRASEVVLSDTTSVKVEKVEI